MNAVAERTMTDDEREEAIRKTLRAMTMQTCREKRMEMFHEIKRLIAGRSAEAIARLEYERNLA